MGERDSEDIDNKEHREKRESEREGEEKIISIYKNKINKNL